MNAPIELIPSQREAFDLPRDRVWMNCAQMSPLHRDVAAAGSRAVLRKCEPWNAATGTFLPEVEEVRAEFAPLFGASAEAIAVIPACSYGTATAAQNLPLARGQTVVVVEGQFPSNRLIWARRCRETGATLVTTPRTATGAITEPLLEAIDETTAIVACGAVHWSDGTRIDLHAVSQRARTVGAALVLDLTQSLGAVPFDCAAIDPDFAVAPSYKWLLGPYSLGGLYVAPRHWNGKPLEESHMDRSDSAGAMAGGDPPYAAGARRFDMGEKTNFQLMPMLLASLRLLNGWGPERISATLTARNRRLAAGFAERGFEPPDERLRAPHYFGLKTPPGTPEDLVQRLAARQVHVSVRNGKLRISPHVWIDDEDEARLFSALDDVLANA